MRIFVGVELSSLLCSGWWMNSGLLVSLVWVELCSIR